MIFINIYFKVSKTIQLLFILCLFFSNQPNSQYLDQSSSMQEIILFSIKYSQTHLHRDGVKKVFSTNIPKKK